MRPFFFGESQDPLFGLHHPPGGPARGQAVVVCPPFGQEYMRAHRALVQLAERLAALGFDVLRFDYFGCGDSAGGEEEGRLDRWIRDTEAAMEEAEGLCGSRRVAVVGLRLGATLAAKAFGRRGAPGPLVLWDPVRDGRLYLDSLRAEHEVWMRERARVREGSSHDPAQRLGFRVPEALRAQIESVDLRLPPTTDRGVLIVRTGRGKGVTTGQEDFAEPGAEVVGVPGPPVWTRDDGDGMNASLVPPESLDRITSWVAARCA